MTFFRALLQPRSVALSGADEALGQAVLSNLAAAGPRGGVTVISRRGGKAPAGATLAPDWSALAALPELAIIANAPGDAVAALGDAARAGARLAILLTADPDGPLPDTALKRALAEAVGKSGCRYIGPGSAGLLLPASGLHAAWIPDFPEVGRLAVVARSAGIVASAAGWARARGIGISRAIALGDEADVSLADALDTLAADTRTGSILIHADAIRDGRAFIVAARSAARVKPVVMLRPSDDDNAGASRDAVIDAVLARAGVLRVLDTEAWFEAAETLSRPQPRRSGPLAIVSNSNGPARLASTAAKRAGILATLAQKTLDQLGAVLPAGTDRGNPLVLPHAASADDYLKAIAILRNDPTAAAIVVVHVPGPGSEATRHQALAGLARALAQITDATAPDVVLCAFGDRPDESSMGLLTRAGIISFELPEQAVHAHAWRESHRRMQSSMRHIPASERATRTITALEASAAGASSGPATPVLRTSDETESPAFLRLCGHLWKRLRAGASTLDEATASEVLRVFGLQPGPDESDQRIPLALAIASDPAFGRVIELTAAGRRAILLPPLNSPLASGPAADAASRLRAIAGHAIAEAHIEAALVALANIAVDLPEIRALGLDCVRIGADTIGWRVVSSHVELLDPAAGLHLALRPYPREFEWHTRLPAGREILIRPIRLNDVSRYQAMLEQVPEDDLLLRFGSSYGEVVRVVPPDLVANLAGFDYGRDITLIALGEDAHGQPEVLGVVDTAVSAGGESAEFSIIVRPDQWGHGLGLLLMERITTVCRKRGLTELYGQIARRNTHMLALAERAGFTRAPLDPGRDEHVVRVAKIL